MSDDRINIRFIYWHLHIKYNGRIRVSYNSCHFPRPFGGKWFEIYEWEAKQPPTAQSEDRDE